MMLDDGQKYIKDLQTGITKPASARNHFQYDWQIIAMPIESLRHVTLQSYDLSVILPICRLKRGVSGDVQVHVTSASRRAIVLCESTRNNFINMFRPLSILPLRYGKHIIGFDVHRLRRSITGSQSSVLARLYQVYGIGSLPESTLHISLRFLHVIHASACNLQPGTYNFADLLIKNSALIGAHEGLIGRILAPIQSTQDFWHIIKAAFGWLSLHGSTVPKLGHCTSINSEKSLIQPVHTDHGYTYRSRRL